MSVRSNPTAGSAQGRRSRALLVKGIHLAGSRQCPRRQSEGISQNHKSNGLRPSGQGRGATDGAFLGDGHRGEVSPLAAVSSVITVFRTH